MRDQSLIDQPEEAVENQTKSPGNIKSFEDVIKVSVAFLPKSMSIIPKKNK